MKNALLALSMAALAGLSHGDEAKVDRKPLNIGGAMEFGPVVKGMYKTGLAPNNAVELEGEWVDHFLAYINQTTVVNDRFFLRAGLGGVFQFRKPEVAGLGFSSHQRKAFFIGPSTTEAEYAFGEPDQPWLKVGLGMFGYKYNPEAANLGEYLFRAMAYPAFVRTGGYLVVNGSNAQIQGFKSNLRLGNFKADVFLATETGLAPLYDWSLAAVLEYSVGGGLLNLGAGVNFQHLLQVKPSRTVRQTASNSYMRNPYVPGDPNWYSGNTDYYGNDGQAGFYDRKINEGGDPALIAGYTVIRDSLRILALALNKTNKDTLFAEDNVTPILDAQGKPRMGWKDAATNKPLGGKYYTAGGTLLMARASLDIKKPFGNGWFGPEDLKLFGEIAVLGVKDYPVFYEDITQRMPMMVGFNFPGFRILDLISLQMEYYDSPWINNIFMRASNRGGNVPFIPPPGDKVISRNTYNDAAARDNVKWSVLVKKNLGKNVSFSTQVASDHLNLTSSIYYIGPQFDPNEITTFRDHWYWISQFSFGI